MRILITGGAGFIGSHLCDRLLAQGHSVIAMDNLITGTTRNIQHLAGNDDFLFIKHNVSNYIFVDGPVDAVLHFASPASPSKTALTSYLQLPIQTLKVGALGTHNALGVAKAKGARFILASTSEIYGDPLEHPQKETYWGHVDPVGPRSVYDEAKRFAEAITMAYHRTHGVDTRIVRIFNTYGPRMMLDDGRVVPNFVGQALRGEPLTVYGDGSQTRSFCYVADLVERHPAPARIRRARPGEPGQPARGHHPGVRRDHQHYHTQPRRRADGGRGPHHRRPPAPPPRHHQGPHRPRLGTYHRPRRRPRPHHRILQHRRSRLIPLAAVRKTRSPTPRTPAAKAPSPSGRGPG